MKFTKLQGAQLGQITGIAVKALIAIPVAINELTHQLRQISQTMRELEYNSRQLNIIVNDTDNTSRGEK